MATVIEECITEEQRSVVRFFLWAEELNAKDVHKEMITVYGGKCLSRKAVHNWVEIATLVTDVSHMTKRLIRRYGSG
jgi:hypothetical protein